MKQPCSESGFYKLPREATPRQHASHRSDLSDRSDPKALFGEVVGRRLFVNSNVVIDHLHRELAAGNLKRHVFVVTHRHVTVDTIFCNGSTQLLGHATMIDLMTVEATGGEGIA